MIAIIKQAGRKKRPYWVIETSGVPVNLVAYYSRQAAHDDATALGYTVI